MHLSSSLLITVPIEILSHRKQTGHFGPMPTAMFATLDNVERKNIIPSLVDHARVHSFRVTDFSSAFNADVHDVYFRYR